MVLRSSTSAPTSAFARVFAGALLSLGLAACASSAPPPAPAAAPKASATSAKAPAATAAAHAPGHVGRAEVDEALSHGPPWLLRRVVTEEVLRDGKFVGWRLLALPKEWTVDLKPGDVVKTVNGIVLERPDDLFNAWTALASAREMKVAYERDGAPREVLLAIDGEPSKQALLPAEPQKQQRSGIRKGTVVIEDQAPPGGQSATEY